MAGGGVQDWRPVSFGGVGLEKRMGGVDVGQGHKASAEQ